MTFDPKDDARLTFLQNEAHDVFDLNLSEAKLVDDISENGERELKHFERHLADNIMQRFKQRRRQ